MVKKIVLSTDIGSDIDDALALHISTRHPNIKLLGIYTTNGDLLTRAKIAKAIIDLAKYPTIIALGEVEALNKYPPSYSTGHEKKMVLPKYKRKNLWELGIVEEGVTDLISKLKSNNPAIVSIAPLTNIAKAIKESPEIDNKETIVYIMGGRENLLEHNFRHDAEAAKRVLNSNLELIVIPANVCEKYRIALTDFRKLKSESGKYIGEMLNNWISYKTWEGFMQGRIYPLYPRMLGEGARFPKFFINLIDALSDQTYVEEHPKEYNQTFISFMNIIKKHKEKPFFDEIYREVIKRIPKYIDVHDAYAVYAVLHPEKIKTKRVNLYVGLNGEMFIKKGRKHNLVVDLDYRHFKEFLGTYLK